MRPDLELAECLKDSPRFRASLEDTETDIDSLEIKLEKVVKLCGGMIDAGKTFSNANRAFIHGVRDVAEYFKGDDLVNSALSKFTHVLSEIQKYNDIVLDQAHRSVCKNLNNFVKSDIKHVKETRRHFDRVSDELDSALLKHAGVSRSRPQDGEDAANVLTATRACFTHNVLDYVYQIKVLHSKKRFDVLDTMLSFMGAQSTFFHQGYDLFDGLDPFMKQVATQLEELHVVAETERKTMEDTHAKLQQSQQVSLQNGGLGASPVPSTGHMEGYLFKRTSNAFKTWVRRWFSIENNQLVYRKRSRDVVATVMEDDLRFCSVKRNADIDRRFCFEIISPTRSHILQADCDADCAAWIEAIQAGVSKAYNTRGQPHPDDEDETHDDESEAASVTSTSQPGGGLAGGSRDSSATDLVNPAPTPAPTPAAATAPPAKPAASSKPREPKGVSRMRSLLATAGNERCADCGASDPRWASINLGITLCIACSGIHRSFGVQVSKVRSVTLDAWEPELVKVMAELGNTHVNSIYEACVPADAPPRASSQCDHAVREAWIRAKYVGRAFVRPLSPPATPSPAKWSVQKHRKRRSAAGRRATTQPAKEPEAAGIEAAGIEAAGIEAAGIEAAGIEAGGIEAAAVDEAGSHDSGISSTGTAAVIVFGDKGEEEQGSDMACSSDLCEEDSEDDSADTRSTTSAEDVAALSPDRLLYRAAQARNLAVMLQGLACGANVNWKNPSDDGKTPLIKAVESGSMAPTEFLLLNGAKVDVKDDRGRTPLHHAAILGHTGHVCQLLKRKANQHAVDEDGNNPLAIAVNNANADIVTLLRLAKMNEEMMEAEGIYGGQDETFSEVFRDFTNMANNSPEKLSRNRDPNTQ